VNSMIIDRGCGPQIAGSRITVYDVLYETEEGLQPAEIADLFELSLDEVNSALQFIEDNKDDVRRDYAAIQARHARGNSPEVQARWRETHAKYEPLLKSMRRIQG
jgi:uncharacterized protein (DUF433 family)